MASPKIKRIEVGDKTRYRWVADIGADPKTGKRRQLTKTYDTRKEAQRELAKVLNDVNRGTFSAPSKMTVGEWLEQWIAEVTFDKADNTVENCRHALKPVIERYGAKPLQRFTSADVVELRQWMTEHGRKRGGKVGTGLSARSVQLTLSRLRSALSLAVERNMVAVNVAASVKPPKVTTAKRDPWTAAEVKAFLATLAEERLKAVMLLSLIGMRPAEVCGLRWSDVDLAAGTLQIANTRTIVWENGGSRVVEKAPKTESGERTLPLPAPVSAALLDLKMRQADEKEAAGEAYTNSGYVLVDELGEPCRTDWLRRRAYVLMGKAKVRKVRLYDARHACLTYLMNDAGVPDTIVSAWAGHADLSLAKRTYNHPTADHLRQGSEALGKLLG